MSQIVVKHAYNIGWGGTSGQLPLNGGDYATFSGFGANSVRIPVSCACTAKNLVVQALDSHADFTITLAKNNSATSLTVTVPAATTTAVSDITHTVSVNAGDDLSLLLTGAGDGHPAGDCGFSLQLLTTDATLSTYGIAPLAGSLSSGQAEYGGAFGNGVFSGYASATPSNTYSIACVAGSVTRLDLVNYRGDLGGGNTVTAAAVLNGVIQDGSGGTVDTRVSVTGATPSAASTFTLPIAVGDKVDLYWTYVGTGLAFALANFGLGCLFASSTANTFHWCGGTNDAITGSTDTWHWPTNDQNATTEPAAQSPVGPVGFTVTGLYVAHGGSGGSAGKGWSDAFRVNGADSTLVVSVLEPATTGLVTANVSVAPAALINTQVAPVNTPLSHQFHWGMSVSLTNPAPPVPTPRATRRLRRFPLPFQQNVWLFLHRLEVLIQSGVGLTTGQGSDPILMLRLSRDGGQTWGNEIQMGMGKLGQYDFRAYANRLGRGRNWVAEVSCSDPVFVAWLACYADMDAGTS